MLKMCGRIAVVVGGGKVGLRKAHALRSAEARVRLIARDIPDGADIEGLELVKGDYSQNLLDGAFAVFACTDDAELNSQIARDGRDAGAIVNVADKPGECDFFMPAVITDGELVISVGTGGASPALAAELRDKISTVLPPRIGEFASLAGDIRSELNSREISQPQRTKILKNLANEQTLAIFLEGGPDAVRHRIERMISEP